MRTDRINHHEDWQKTPFRDFLTQYWSKYQDGKPMPNVDGVRRIARPTVNHGRWVRDCANPDCSSALVVSGSDSFIICVKCGSPENDDQFYRLQFPVDKPIIERALMLRPNIRNRNWLQSEAAADLYRENAEMGVR